MSEKSLPNKAFSGFPLSKRGRTCPFLSRRSRVRIRRARAEAFWCIVLGVQDYEMEILVNLLAVKEVISL